jgi:two-component system sensor histidine kinase ChvG
MLRTIVSIIEARRRPDEPQVTVEIAPAEPGAYRIFGHDRRLGQVVNNLIDNAKSFSPPGGTVRVKARRLRSMVEFAVEDDGPGVPPENLARIFERFYTDRPDGEAFGQNSGLGLAISKQIVEAHDGRIWAENRMGPARAGAPPAPQGARFVVRLPAA